MRDQVQLYIRVRLADGTHPYLRAAYARNGRIKPGFGMQAGRAVEFPACTYHLRYRQGSKRKWEPVGTDASLAVVKLSAKAAALEGSEQTLSSPVPEAQQLPREETKVRTPGRRLLTECAATYLGEVAEHKSAKTMAAYRYTVCSFLAHVGYAVLVEGPTQRRRVECIEDIRREDILAWMSQLKAKGDSPRTDRNRVDFLQIFLHHWKVGSVLTGSDLPKYTRKKVRAYNPTELAKMYEAATLDEVDLLSFLECPGAREQEAQFVCWPDVDLVRKLYTVTEHLDLGYKPKDKEEGTLPIADILVERLLARRKRYPRTRLIFPGKNGKPNGHALGLVKRLALRAGVHCGLCVNKSGLSCATHPVCRNVLLHKMRKTSASTLHHNGLPAQTLQRYLRHSDLSTKGLYSGPTR